MDDMNSNTRPEADYLQAYLDEVLRYQQRIERCHPEMRVRLIELKSKQLVFVGKLAAEFAEISKMTYATRKQVYTEAFFAAEKYKKEEAEKAVFEWRKQEAKDYGNWQRWKNAKDTLKEEINALKYHVKQDIADGSRQG
ncbi:hypothetical protein [Halobacillus karajensis]|uniref:hypothetical protein n=1 Tax=Halobacillus karajensis TaxID=195088 RepID=UPI0009F3A800|nr:hypothetical protein [Halobacillus karajensis]